MLFATTHSSGRGNHGSGPDPWPNSRVSDQVADNFYKASSDAARSIAADKRPMLNGSDSPVGTAARHIICRHQRMAGLGRNPRATMAFQADPAWIAAHAEIFADPTSRVHPQTYRIVHL
jgi:hypothetical protein